MKKWVINFLFLVVLVLLTGCWGGLDFPEPKVPSVPKMPEHTLHGLHTFGCYVNGQEFVSRRQLDLAYAFGSILGGNSGYDTLEARLNPLYYDETKYELSIHAPLRDVHRKISQDIYLSIHLDSLALGVFQVKGAGFNDHAVSCTYNNNPAPYGTLTITHLDTTAKIVSGRFEFVQPAKGNCNENIITDGRFDLKMLYKSK